MVFCKMGPATPEVHLAISIVPHLYLVGSSSSRVFAKNSFTKFSPIHEFSKLQRHPLNFTALGASNTEEGIQFWRRRRRSITRQSAQTWCSSRTLGLILTPHRAARAPFHRHGWRSHHKRSVDLFLLPQGWSRPCFATYASTFRCKPLASAMEGKHLEKKP
jgi:hypothetical protein